MILIRQRLWWTGRGRCLTVDWGPDSGSTALRRTLELGGYAHGFHLDTPFEKYPAKVQNLLLYGYPPAGAKRNANEIQPKPTSTEKGFRFQES